MLVTLDTDVILDLSNHNHLGILKVPIDEMGGCEGESIKIALNTTGHGSFQAQKIWHICIKYKGTQTHLPDYRIFLVLQEFNLNQQVFV